MTTKEQNRLIVEFMGIEPTTTRYGPLYLWSDLPYFSCSHNSREEVMDSIAGYSKYHTSWDWLMPVVERISDLCEEPEELDGLKHALLCNDIHTAYNFVVDFIEEDNKN